MTSPSHDLSQLRINRDKPSGGSKRALSMTVVLAMVALVFVASAIWWIRGGGSIEVQVARAEVVGGEVGGVGITANGYVVARTKASVSSRISGRLAYLGVSEGSVVREGEIMARLENADYQATVAQREAELLRANAALLEAEAQRDQLVRDLQRGEELLSSNLTSEQSVEDIGARLAGAEARVGVQEAVVLAAAASVEVAKANLANTIIRAPFGGTILRKDAEVGEVVAPAATGGGLTRGAVVTMADLETLEVEVDVNEAYIAQITAGQPARIILDAYPNSSYGAEVRQIVPTADRQRATVQVKVSFTDRDSRILPEMGCRVEFLEVGNAEDTSAEPLRIFVPADGVQNVGGKTIVWIVRNGTVTEAQVDAGPVSGGRREIRSGLTGGEQIVIDPPDGIENGQPVQIASTNGQ